MIEKGKLDPKILNAIAELDNYKRGQELKEHCPEKLTREVLLELKRRIQGDITINERLLRAFRDIGVISIKNFEFTPLQKAISDINEYFYRSLPHYKHLQPLRKDFGKGEPF